MSDLKYDVCEKYLKELKKNENGEEPEDLDEEIEAAFDLDPGCLTWCNIPSDWSVDDLVYYFTNIYEEQQY